MPDPSINDMLLTGQHMDDMPAENQALREQALVNETTAANYRTKYESLANAVNSLVPEKAQQIFALAASKQTMQLKYDQTQAEGEALYNEQASGVRLTPEQQEKLNDDMGLQ